jgi:hypothetical protein
VAVLNIFRVRPNNPSSGLAVRSERGNFFVTTCNWQSSILWRKSNWRCAQGKTEETYQNRYPAGHRYLTSAFMYCDRR